MKTAFHLLARNERGNREPIFLKGDNLSDSEYIGGVAERFKVPPWKGGVRENVPGVRISLSPLNMGRKHKSAVPGGRAP